MATFKADLSTKNPHAVFSCVALVCCKQRAERLHDLDLTQQRCDCTEHRLISEGRQWQIHLASVALPSHKHAKQYLQITASRIRQAKGRGHFESVLFLTKHNRLDGLASAINHLPSHACIVILNTQYWTSDDL